MVADLWQVIGCVLPPKQQCLARVSGVFPQKDGTVLRKGTDPSMGIWVFLYL